MDDFKRIAAAIATINRLAPGRTFISLATGHTAWRMMGHPPRRLELFEEAVKVVRGLTRGETVPFRFEDRETLIRLDMADLGFVDTAHPIRIDVAAMGPKGTEIAGRLSDGILDPNAKSPARIRGVWGASVSAALHFFGGFRRLPKLGGMSFSEVGGGPGWNLGVICWVLIRR